MVKSANNRSKLPKLENRLKTTFCVILSKYLNFFYKLIMKQVTSGHKYDRIHSLYRFLAPLTILRGILDLI